MPLVWSHPGLERPRAAAAHDGPDRLELAGRHALRDHRVVLAHVHERVEGDVEDVGLAGRVLIVRVQARVVVVRAVEQAVVLPQRLAHLQRRRERGVRWRRR